MFFFHWHRENIQLRNDPPALDLRQTDGGLLDPGRASEWSALLARQQDRLQILAGSTESEFLAIGDRLQDFYQRAADIGGAFAAVVDQVGGEETQEAMQGLARVVDRMGEVLTILEDVTERDTRVLEKTLQLIARVDEPLAGFKKIMKSLQVLGTSTKIESARLGQLGADFEILAGDVKQLSVLIREKSADVSGRNSSLSAQIRETLAQVSYLEAVQRENVRLVLDKTRSSLKTITAVHENCAEVAMAIAAASSDVSRNIGEVVTSMQFHDITRQQVEHVHEAIGCLQQRLTIVPLETGDCAGKELVIEASSVCQLQHAQLLHARDELMAAVFSIVENLRGIASKERAIAGETGGMVGVADRAGDSIFTEIEKSLGFVASALAESSEANRNLSRAIGSVAATVGDILVFVDDIEEIGEEIKLIALNSQIKAALTGNRGAALGVLAEAIQRLSVDACEQTAAVTDTLREISRITGVLFSGDAGDCRAMDEETATLDSDLKGLVDSLCGMNSRLMVTLARTDEAVHALSNDIETATAGITVHETVAAAVDEVAAELQEIMAQAVEVVPEAAMADLTELSARYTMQSERKVHVAVIGALPGEETPVAEGGGILPPDTAEDSDGLGENVELF